MALFLVDAAGVLGLSERREVEYGDVVLALGRLDELERKGVLGGSQGGLLGIGG